MESVQARSGQHVSTAVMIPSTGPGNGEHNQHHGDDLQEALERQQSIAATNKTPRCLPSPDVSVGNIEDSYVQFMLYCNPFLPPSTDTTELRKGFQSMPKTDGKTFEAFTLFKLIKKLEAKEIATWALLVLEMGVEPPDLSKNQSPQKVQQYAVRLKRWLHAYHIDAFFQYCLGKTNSYHTELPTPRELVADTFRDGVPPEEDLALRALVPEWRPKRGRRKVEASIADLDTDAPAKRIQRASSASADKARTPPAEASKHPQSAFPWDGRSMHEDLWAAAQRAIPPQAEDVHPNRSSPYPGQQTFWMDVPSATPATPYPQSAITPRPSLAPYSAVDGPHSSHPLDSSPGPLKKRQSHLVSAAWPSSSPSSGKLRGRPPSNRTIQDGPFSTFPVNPSATPTASRRTGTPEAVAYSQTTPIRVHPASSPLNPASAHRPPRRNKLQLHVPQHLGGPVRLATPPRVLVNGEDNSRESTESYAIQRGTSAEFFNNIDDEVSELGEGSNDEADNIDWKRRALALRRKLKEKEAELKAIRRRVLDAVM